MTNEQQNNVFRLAAIIYGRSASGISLNKSHQKVIDDALFCCGKEAISSTDLIVYIKQNYGLLYTDNEVKELVSGRDSEKKYHSYMDHEEFIISLTTEYKIKLSLLCQEKNLYDYIDEYFSIHQEEDPSRKGIVLRFLYEMFTSNLEGYKLILHEQYGAVVADAKFTDDEKRVINGFLNWQNNEKNKAIFDLAGYALEYCMMTNKKNTSLNTRNLKNKSFYIDTNILYRSIGLNGDNLKTRALLFLSKFKEVGEKLVVSQSTYLEFVDSIDYYVGKIDKSQRPSVRTGVLMEFIDEDSIYLFYCKWRVGRANRDSSYFKDWIMSEFDAICSRYEIEREIKPPYDFEQRRKDLEDISSSILESDPEKSTTAAEFDAENVLWVEEMRKGCGDDIYQAKAFLLSSDNNLRRWDYQRNTNRVPIVMSPSQWLGIILHYVERTSDDYQSFVSFLTLTIRREAIPFEKVSLIIQGIAQTTSDIETQQHLVRNFIERKTFDEVDSMSDEKLEHAAEEFAKTELDARIEGMRRERRKGNKVLSKTQRELKKAKEELEVTKQAKEEGAKGMKEVLDATLTEKGHLLEENNDLKTQLLNNWKVGKIIFGASVIVISVMLCFMVFLWHDAKWNFMYDFVSFLDTNKDSVAIQLGQAIVLLPLTTLAYGGIMIKDAIDVVEYDKKKCRFFWKSKQ